MVLGRIFFRALNPGMLQRVIPEVRQIFHRFQCSSFAQLPDDRFVYFTEQVFKFSFYICLRSFF